MSDSRTHNQNEGTTFLRWEESGQRHEIAIDSEITIGRAPGNRIVINDPLISRNHCVITPTLDGFSVLDLQSANGTFINGERVLDQKRMVPGDLLKVGGVEFRLEVAAPSPPAVGGSRPVQTVRQEPSPGMVSTMAEVPRDRAGSPTPPSTMPGPAPSPTHTPGAGGKRFPAFLSWEIGYQEFRRLVGDGVTIGRSSQADITINDLLASRFHCRVEPENGGYAVVDMGSTNGTFVNDERVKDRAMLKDGDVIRTGQSSFRFDIEERVSMRIAQAAARAPSAPYVSTEAMPVETAVEAPAVAAPVFAVPSLRPDTPTVIEVRNVIKEFDSPSGRVRILKSVSLEVRAGEFVGVRGPSGSGKSTLLNMITGIDRPTSGEVIVAGQTLNKLSENKMARWRGNSIGVIFQFFQLLPTLTVIENVMLPMDFCRKWSPRDRPKRAMALLEQVELAEHANKLPSMLSGGQQQRAAIARALANEPPLIVADEPTGNLDSKTADLVFMMFQELVMRGTTFLMVTHDTDLASRIPRVLDVRDGELFEHHSPVSADLFRSVESHR